MTSVLDLNAEPGWLHPKMRAGLVGLHDALHRQDKGAPPKFRYRLIEGYRSPQRQHHLFTGVETTVGREWESAHNFGLAAQFAIVINDEEIVERSFALEPAWERFEKAASRCGLLSGGGPGYVEHCCYWHLRKLLSR